MEDLVDSHIVSLIKAGYPRRLVSESSMIFEIRTHTIDANEVGV